MISVFRVSIVVYFIIFIQSHDFCVHFHWFRPFRLMRAITHARISTRANLSVLAIWRMHEKLCSAEKVLFHRIFFFQSFVYVYERHLCIMRYIMSIAYRRRWLRRPKATWSGTSVLLVFSCRFRFFFENRSSLYCILF